MLYIYLLKVNNRNTRARREVCSKLTIKQNDANDVVLVSLCPYVSIVDFEHVIADWEVLCIRLLIFTFSSKYQKTYFKNKIGLTFIY